MTYNATTGNLEISTDTLRRVSDDLIYVLRGIRETAGLPMDKYDRGDVCLTPADHAQRAVLDVAATLGITMGGKWGNEIDLRNKDDLKLNNQMTRAGSPT